MTERHYTHSIVSYAELKDIRRILDNAKHWAYIYHDKDTTSPHYHIVATFQVWKSVKQVCEMVESDQNTFSEPVKAELSDVLAYFTHKHNPEKFQYNESDIVYSDIGYWNKRVNNGEDEVNKNEIFVDDLLADDIDWLEMSKKYGRDFIKNISKYRAFRHEFRNDDLSLLAKMLQADEINQTKIMFLEKQLHDVTTMFTELKERYNNLQVEYMQYKHKTKGE